MQVVPILPAHHLLPQPPFYPRTWCVRFSSRQANGTSGTLSRCCSSSRLKQLGPTTVDIPADEDMFQCVSDISAPLFIVDNVGNSAEPQESACSRVPTAQAGTAVLQTDKQAATAAAAENALQTHSSNTLQAQHGEGWTQSNDEDIQYAVAQLLRRQPAYGSNASRRQRSSAQTDTPPQLVSATPSQQNLQEQQQLQLAVALPDDNHTAANGSHETSNSTLHAHASAAAAAATAAGSFFISRAAMLAQLQQQQRQMQRRVLLKKQRKSLYTYTLSESGEIVKVPRTGLKSPLAQTEFALAKRKPSDIVDGASNSSSTDQDVSLSRSDSSTGVTKAAAAAADVAGEQQNSQAGNVIPQQTHIEPLQQQRRQQQQQQQLQLQQQWLELQDDYSSSDLDQVSYNSSSSTVSRNSSSSRATNPSSSSSSSSSAADAMLGDPSRGLSLSAFLYCCSRNKLLALTWQLGLPPGSLQFVNKVSDADLVLHVKPGPGERHYQYDDYREQAAAKGIPFVDLKNLSLQELQLYLLPVYRLYAGELSPRDLLRRKKWKGRKRRYTNVKLPPA